MKSPAFWISSIITLILGSSLGAEELPFKEVVVSNAQSLNLVISEKDNPNQHFFNNGLLYMKGDIRQGKKDEGCIVSAFYDFVQGEKYNLAAFYSDDFSDGGSYALFIFQRLSDSTAISVSCESREIKPLGEKDFRDHLKFILDISRR